MFTHLAVILVAAVFCVAAMVFFAFYVRQRSALQDAQEESLSILRKYKADDSEGIVQNLDEHHAR
ncbi:MAG: hypothetical protein J6S50_11200, partial [Oscillospiraceae bacterium]|nr:hypothetical protein [Oscillospiraceae bacterium]